MSNQTVIEMLAYQTSSERKEEPDYVITDELRRKDRELYGLFQIGPVEKGQGTTIANSLRRTLLHDLTAFTITSVQFEPIYEENELLDSLHEYTSIPGVWESILEILGNLKDVLIRRIEDPLEPLECQEVELIFTEPGVIYASDLNLPDFFNILNPEQPLFTVVSPQLKLKMNLTIESKMGSGLWAPNQQAYSLDEALVVTEFCLPILQCNYVIKADPLEGFEGSESILFEVLTNGTVTPQEAVDKAGEICTNLFRFIPKSEPEVGDVFVLEPEPKVSTQHTDSFFIEDLGLSVRAYNCLKRAEITTISDLLNYTKADLLEMKNFGKKSAEEVNEALQNLLGVNLPS